MLSRSDLALSVCMIHSKRTGVKLEDNPASMGTLADIGLGFKLVSNTKAVRKAFEVRHIQQS